MDTAGNEGALTPRRHWLLPAGCSEVIAFTRLLRANQNEGAGSRGTDLRGGTPFTLHPPPHFLPHPQPASSCRRGGGGNVSALLALVSVRIKVFSSRRVAATVIIWTSCQLQLRTLVYLANCSTPPVTFKSAIFFFFIFIFLSAPERSPAGISYRVGCRPDGRPGCCSQPSSQTVFRQTPLLAANDFCKTSGGVGGWGRWWR